MITGSVLKLRRAIIAMAVMALLGACTSNGAGGEDSVSAPAVVPAIIPPGVFTGSDTIMLTSLGESNLPHGSCGMVLWTLDANRPVPVLRYVVGDKGEFHLNRVPHELIRTNVGGNDLFGIFPRQSFVAGNDIKIGVELQFGQGFDGGTYLKRGVIILERPEGPTLVTPVAGIAGCRG